MHTAPQRAAALATLALLDAVDRPCDPLPLTPLDPASVTACGARSADGVWLYACEEAPELDRAIAPNGTFWHVEYVPTGELYLYAGATLEQAQLVTANGTALAHIERKRQDTECSRVANPTES